MSFSRTPLGLSFCSVASTGGMGEGPGAASAPLNGWLDYSQLSPGLRRDPADCASNMSQQRQAMVGSSWGEKQDLCLRAMLWSDSCSLQDEGGVQGLKRQCVSVVQCGDRVLLSHTRVWPGWPPI